MKNQTKHLVLFLVAIALNLNAQSSLLQNFQTPPNAAKPRVWWHWMNGNISKEGIQKDLDWMKQVGIGGFQNFDANLFTPVVVPKKLVFMQPDWKDAFKFTTEYADKNGLEMAIAGSPGWSVTGGPWVEPKDGMKKYVWTEALVEGGKKQSIQMPNLPDVIGKIQDVETHAGGVMGAYVGKAPHFAADAMVIAYKLPANEKHLMDSKPKMTKNGGDWDTKGMLDHDYSKSYMLPPMEIGQDMYVQYEFETPQTFKAFTIGVSEAGELAEFNGGPTNRSLKVSDDGVNFRTVAKVSNSVLPIITTAIPATTAKYWRLCFETLKPEFSPIMAMMGMPPPTKPNGVNVSEFVLFNTSRIDQAEDKAGFSAWKETTASYTEGGAAEAIPTTDVIDLTGKMKADGTLDWDVPAGNWLVVRLGYSLTGRQNHPASPEATGLEVDKLDKDAVRKYINTYLDMYKDATGGMMGEKGLTHMILDSYEAGHTTWTKAFPEEFQKRRGYDIKAWIPVLTGRIVKSAEASEKFLWDFRKTIGELIAENHYDVIGEELHKRGMKRYTESHESGRIYLADGMDVKRNADIPMSAMWTPGSLGSSGSDEEVRSEADIREAASVAHIYGKPYVAAESMTAIQNAFSWHPEKLKRTADLEMASGLNRFVIHTSVHQPLDDKMPGFSLGPFGQYFTRQETWSGAGAKAWMTYLGRSCQLLQEGKFVADVLYFYGENTNVTWVCRDKLPKIEGYEYDFCNSTALKLMQVQNGKIVAPSGAAYSVLVLDESAKNMTLPVLKKIRDLVKAGAKVAGVKPVKSPSLSDNDAEFQAIVNEIWGKNPQLETQNFVEILRGAKVSEDVVIKNAKSKILYVHRKTAVEHIYWLNNRSEEANDAEISFRVSGAIPELWNPQTGKTERVSYQIKDGRTIIPLTFEPWGAYFIIFKEKATANSVTLPIVKAEKFLEVTTPWTVSFQEGRGAPTSTTLNKLASLTENTDGGIKYFSGTATYKNTFTMPNLTKDAKYELDLGDVKNIAEVVLNGKNIGTAWKKPFKLDITEGVKTGENVLEIRVTNTWVNRLIGDAQPDVKNKITFTTMPFYQANSPLLPSGLLGPVVILKK